MDYRRDDSLIDPDFRPIVEAQRERVLTRPPLHTITPAMMRERAEAEFVPWNADPLPMHSMEDFTVSHHGRAVPVRLYEPTTGLEGPLIVHFHGGGWTIGSPQMEDAATRFLARHTGTRILSVDYRLAPEHRFPAPLEDAEAVFGWLETNAAEMRVNPARIAFSGASSGANIALGSALRLRDAGHVLPYRLVLLYGGYLGHNDTASSRIFGDGTFGLSAAAMDYFWDIYTGCGNNLRHPHAVPGKAVLAGLPPVYLNYAGLDVLAEDSVIMARLLREAGVAVTIEGYPGAIHGFTQYIQKSPVAQRAVAAAGDWLTAAFAAPE